jgi:hypothetical protein
MSKGQDRRATAVLVVACTCIFSGCLPTGKAPVGQHVLADRSLTSVYLSPSETEGVPSHLLVTGPWQEYLSNLESYYFADLYAIPYQNLSDTANGLAGRQPMVKDFVFPFGITAFDILTDSRGRLFVTYLSEPRPGQEPIRDYNALRLDLTTGTHTFLGRTFKSAPYQNLIPSPARTRVLVFSSIVSAQLVDFDSSSWISTNSIPPSFIGEDTYYVDSEDGVWAVYRSKPDAAPEEILTSALQIGIHPVQSEGVPKLLVGYWPLESTSTNSTYALLDTQSLATTELPRETEGTYFLSISPDDRWLAFAVWSPANDSSQPSEDKIILFDWTTGQLETLDSARVGKPLSVRNAEWRPGQNEFWFSTFPDGFAIWKPGQPLTLVPATRHSYYRSPYGPYSSFTRDGLHWFSTNSQNPPTISVGRTDSPLAPLFPINPPGTQTTTHWETQDGRLLVGAWTDDVSRKDMYLVDPDTGQSRAICSNGHLWELGHTRVLALLNWELARSTGDLNLIDLNTGAQTLLAENVYAVDVDRGPSATVPSGTDRLSPGTRVAYLTRHRLNSPHDGLWVAELP